MLVSIIVPIYGVEHFIEKCAVSLFEQSYPNIEYIFVNDCTLDGSMDVLRGVMGSYPQKETQIKIIEHEQNRGLSAARNTGMKIASGDYIMHVDSDDYVEKDYVQMCVKRVLDTNADIVTVARNLIYADKTKIIIPQRFLNVNDWKKAILRGSFPHTVWGSLIRKELYVKNSITAVEGLHQGEDFVVMAKIAYYVNKVEVIEIPLYNYVIRTAIYSYKDKIVLDTYRSWKIVDEFYREKDDYDSYSEILRKRLLSFYAWQIMSWQLSCPENAKASECIRNTFPSVTRYKGLPIRKKIIVFLFESKLYFILRMYISLSRGVQLMLNRRGTEL